MTDHMIDNPTMGTVKTDNLQLQVRTKSTWARPSHHSSITKYFNYSKQKGEYDRSKKELHCNFSRTIFLHQLTNNNVGL